MKQISLIFLLVLSLFLFFGCTQVPFCGDNSCNGIETSQTCQIDCGVPSTEKGYLEVNVTDSNTGLGIPGVSIVIVELLGDTCGISESSNQQHSFKTDEKGSLIVELDAEKNYLAAYPTADFYPSEAYKCSKVYARKTALINYSLLPLPAKPLCQQLAGTIEMAVGESIDVNGGNLYPNQTVKIYLSDWMLEGFASDFNYNWVQMYQAKWLLRDGNNNASEYVQVLPPKNLKNGFTNESFYNDVNFLTTCWKEGNDLPFAVISSN